MRESDKILAMLETETSRLQNLIHRYFTQPNADLLKEITSLRDALNGQARPFGIDIADNGDLDVLPPERWRGAEGLLPEAEVGRVLQICNACRYCEGYCAVFPAMERRRGFGDGDLNYLANLCHGCGACVASCRPGAITLRGFTDQQILSEIESLAVSF